MNVFKIICFEKHFLVVSLKQPIVLHLKKVVSFLSKPIVGQICIYCASESDNKGIYLRFP